MALLHDWSTRFAPLKGRTVGRQYQSVVLMLLVSGVLLGAFGARLVQLQLVQGERNYQLAQNNRIRLVPKRPARGALLDRNGSVLAGSRLSLAVSVWPIALAEDEWAPVIERLSTVLAIPAADLEARIAEGGYSSLESITVARGITPAQATALEEYGSELPGVRLEMEAVRNYPNGDLASHVLGYTGELSDEQFEERREEGYRLGDVVGQAGSEVAFEHLLRGTWGGQQVEVDSAGRIIRTLGDKPAIAGQDVQLTLDIALQQAAEAALGERRGAVVAMDPRNGEVLAMASWPTYDPNIFTGPITEAQWQAIQGNGYPFVNRALQSFPPASTFKIVTTAAAIESGIYAPTTVLPTYPYIQVGGIRFADWNHAGFGPLNFQGAMAMSSDTFFYQIAQGIGGEELIAMTRRFGFGRYTGIELSFDESPGLVPDDAWKQETQDLGWLVGDSINMSIGQGFLLATPLQVAQMFAVVANDGYLVTPHLHKTEADPASWREDVGLSEVTMDVLRQGLRQVMTSGTARGLDVGDLPPFAGKTGTAEADPGLSHAWFGAYAPLDNPEIVVVTFAEHSGGGGGAVAAPMAVQVLQAYFANQPRVAAQP